MYLVYSIATLIVLVALSPYFLYQALRHKKYVGSLGQRLGYLPVSFNLDAEPSIWIHAVSVGEVLSVRPIVAELRGLGATDQAQAEQRAFLLAEALEIAVGADAALRELEALGVTQFNIYTMQNDPGPAGIVESFGKDVLPALRS